MTAATAVGDWETVRGAAAKIGMELDGSGPVDECWELVEVQQRSSEALIAMRTGPATARIIEVTRPSRPPQRAGTVVVLAPAPVSVPDDEEEFVLKRILTEIDTPTMRTVELDGLHPGDDRWRELRATLHEHGWFADRRAGAAYRVGEGDVEALGFYAWAALPAATSDAAAHALLTDATASWETTFVIWPALAQAAGDEAAARASRPRRALRDRGRRGLTPGAALALLRGYAGASAGSSEYVSPASALATSDADGSKRSP